MRYNINPSWDKKLFGVPGLGNVPECSLRELAASAAPLTSSHPTVASMVSCCGDKIAAAISDPETKKAIDLLNAGDVRDQVGSYRVIVSYETVQLEEFTLCLLQQNVGEGEGVRSTRAGSTSTPTSTLPPSPELLWVRRQNPGEPARPCARPVAR